MAESTAEFFDLLSPIQPMLEAYCRRVLENGNELEDVLQSAMFHAFQKRAGFQPGGNFKAWVFKFVVYECLNANRRCRRAGLRAELDPEEIGVFAPPEGLDEAYEELLSNPAAILNHCSDAVAHAVQDLPVHERNAFLLRALGGFSYREISGLLDLPMGSVMGYLFRARNRLRQTLSREVHAGRGLPARGGGA